MMRFRQLQHEDLLETATTEAETFIEPFRDTLALYRERTERIRGRWDAPFACEDDRITLFGYPLHSHLEGNLFRQQLGVGIYKHDFWAANPDLAAEALNRSDRYSPGSDIEVRVVDDQALYITDLMLEYGDHLDFFDAMAKRFIPYARRGPITVALVGYLLDPAWAHLRLLCLPGKPRSLIYPGVMFDSNFMFARFVRGRANYGMFAYHLGEASTLTMDDYWSVSTPAINRATDPDLLSVFEQRLDRVMAKTSKRLTRVSRLRQWSRRKTPLPWKQSFISSMGREYLGLDRVRLTLARLEREGANSPVEVGFALAGLAREFSFSRRVSVERSIANRLKTLMKGAK